MLLTNLDVVQNLGYMRLAHHFVAGEDKSHFEVRDLFLDVVNNILNHLELFKKRQNLMLGLEFGP